VTIRARLYDARGDDRDVDIGEIEPGKIDDKSLLWIDVDGHDAAEIDAVARAVALEPRLHRNLAATRHEPRVIRLPDRVGIVLTAIDRAGPEGEESLVRRELDVVVGQNLVITVHDGPLAAMREFGEQVRGESELGLLDSGAFMAGLVDAVFMTYLGEVEGIEREIEKLDQFALRQSANHDDFLARVVELRGRIGLLRRWLAPNRDAIAPLVRPDFELHGDIVPSWPGLLDRLQLVIGAVENARELLVGSLDIYLGRSAQRSNDVMKTLTIVSSIALPAVVLAGVMGMNFHLEFFDNAQNFYVVIVAMLLISITILLLARWRRWI
jgi:magnesium transporter